MNTRRTCIAPNVLEPACRLNARTTGMVVLLLAVCLGSRAQEVIEAKDYSGFLKGDGYGWHGSPVMVLGPLGITWSPPEVTLTWPRRGMLQSASSVLGPWNDHCDAISPCVFPATNSQTYYRLSSTTNDHFGVGSGCPQQGFDFTGLPDRWAANAHWANLAASHTSCGWIVPQDRTGFDQVPAAGTNEAFVRVVLRSFHTNPPPPDAWVWWAGSDTLADDATHQNDGWFHFRVRHPQPLAPPRACRLRFELAFDNPYAFPAGPLQLNRWWMEGTWDWEAHNGRRVYTPMYRLKDLSGAVGPWQHIAETNVHPVEGCTNANRHYRCLFDQTIPAVPWREIEVAQNIPYTLDDRERFLQRIRTHYPPRRPDLCIRKQSLGYGGLHYATNRPPAEREHNELYAIEIFRTSPLVPPGTPVLPNKKLVIFLAGMDYEPAGNYVAEGVALEILERWDTPGFDYRNQASYVILPISNPDAYEWGVVHVAPYGNGYGGVTNLILNGYAFLESTNHVPDSVLDPELLALRNYVRDLTQRGLDGRGGQVVALLDFQNDLCPHPSRWNGPPVAPDAFDVYPPVWGIIFSSDTTLRNAAIALLETLRDPAHSPYTAPYVRDPNNSKGWRAFDYAEHGIPLWLLFEFDGAALFSLEPSSPDWMQGEFPEPIQLPRRPFVTPHFYVHGYLDQVGQATAPDGDPAYVFKQFGRDIANAVRKELLP